MNQSRNHYSIWNSLLRYDLKVRFDCWVYEIKYACLIIVISQYLYDYTQLGYSKVLAMLNGNQK